MQVCVIIHITENIYNKHIFTEFIIANITQMTPYTPSTTYSPPIVLNYRQSDIHIMHIAGYSSEKDCQSQQICKEYTIDRRKMEKVN